MALGAPPSIAWAEGVQWDASELQRGDVLLAAAVNNQRPLLRFSVFGDTWSVALEYRRS